MNLVVNVKSGARYDVYVGRGSDWGNLFTHQPLEKTKAKVQVASRIEAIKAFEHYILTQRSDLVERAKRELKGKILGCHCAPYPCHAEVWVRIANQV